MMVDSVISGRMCNLLDDGLNTYTYDQANRLSNAGGVAYTWDDNSNLLSDGASTYTYDQANRLISVMNMPPAVTFTYNGLGDRMQQTYAGNTITYLLDLASGLTQVLADGESTYLYGLGRIGEKGTLGWQYHLGDALGSVRQLTDASGSPSSAAQSSSSSSVTNSPVRIFK